jgi:ribonuclease P protein component
VTAVARLRGRRTFTALAQQGRTVRNGPLRVRFLAAPAGQPASVGYAIGKATGPAVDRNRIRRRVRAAVQASTMPLTSGLYLVSADPSVAHLPFADLVATWNQAATRAAEPRS